MKRSELPPDFKPLTREEASHLVYNEPAKSIDLLDTGQRIFRQGFSWKSLGVDIRGRSRTLTVNYRTSHQIRRIADKLLGNEVSDVDGNTEARNSTISVFNGPDPEVVECEDWDAEVSKVSNWLKDLIEQGLQPHEVCVCVRSRRGQ